MDIKEKIQAVNLEKEALMQKYQALKTEFQSYISNKNIPVIERWEYFVQPPVN